MCQKAMKNILPDESKKQVTSKEVKEGYGKNLSLTKERWVAIEVY